MKASLALRLLAVIALAAATACSSAHEDSSGDAAAASATPGAPDAAATTGTTGTTAQYPPWAAAVVAEYPNHIDTAFVTDNLFQIDTADDPKTVVAWFKAHASAPVTSSDPDSAPRWYVNTSGVSIAIEPWTYPGTTGIKTMIAFSRK
jgi:hypothetical protein